MAQGWPLLSQGQRRVYPVPRLQEHLSPELSRTHTATHNTKEGQSECLDCLGWSGCPQGGWQCPNAQWSEVITVLYKGSRHQLHRVTSRIRWGWGHMAAALGFLICWLAELAFRRRKGPSPGGVRRLVRAPGRGSRGPGLESLAHTLGATWGRGQMSQAEQGSQAAASTCPQHRCGCGTHLARPWSCPQVPPGLPRPLGAATQELARQGSDPRAPPHTHTRAGPKGHSARGADHWFHPDCGQSAQQRQDRNPEREPGQTHTQQWRGVPWRAASGVAGQPHKLPKKGNP